MACIEVKTLAPMFLRHLASVAQVQRRIEWMPKRRVHVSEGEAPEKETAARISQMFLSQVLN